MRSFVKRSPGRIKSQLLEDLYSQRTIVGRKKIPPAGVGFLLALVRCYRRQRLPPATKSGIIPLHLA